LVEKKVKLSDTIHRANIKTFQNIHDKDKKASGVKSVKKEYAYAQRIIDIAQSRGHTMDDLFE
jgi:macrodomain Ter protein organizer (MatP/YcbG family)